MKMNRLKGSVLSVVLGCVCCLSGCTQEQTLKLAEVTHSVFYAPQYVAIEQGYFEEEGLDVELIGTQGADKTMAALLSGEVQIGLMGPEAAIYVHNQGREDEAKIFAQLTKRDGSFIVGRKPSADFTLEELAGTSILGGRKGGVPEMTLEYALKQAGLVLGTDKDAGQVNVRTDIQFGVMAGAFAGGEGDYVTLFEPSATMMVQEGKGYILASVGELTGEIPYTAYITLESYMEDRSDQLMKFTRAVSKGQEYVQNHSAEEIATCIQPQFKEMPYEDLVKVVERYQSIDAWNKTPYMKEESLNRLMEVMILAGELDEKVAYDRIVDMSYVYNLQ